MDNSGILREEKNADQWDLGLVVDRYYRMVYGICFSMTGNACDADELAHDSFVEAYLHREQLKDQARLGGWLRTLALNVCRTWRRKRQRLVTVELDENIAAPGEDTADRYSSMYSGMSRLSKDHRLVLALHYFEGLSYAEIARFLVIPTGTVMSRLSRARNLLKEELKIMDEDQDSGMVPDIKFKEEIQAEVALLVSMENCKAGVGARLRGIFDKSPERLLRLLKESDDEAVLQNIAIIVPRLGDRAMQDILAAFLSTDRNLAEHAATALGKYLSRCEPVSVTGAETNMASPDAYVLIDQLDKLAVGDEAKAKVLFECVESCKDSASRALFVSALLSYGEPAFALLMGRFFSDKGGGRWVKHALVRTGNRFAEELYVLLSGGCDDEKRLGLLGLETIARSMQPSWIEDASPERFANELRVADRYPPIRKGELDSDLLSRLTGLVAELAVGSDSFLRNSALGVLGHLQAMEHVQVVRDSLSHEDPATRLAAIRVLAGMGDVSSCVDIEQKARDGAPEERLAAVEAMGQMGMQGSVAFLKQLADGGDPGLREASITALGGIGSKEAEDALAEMLKCPDTRKSAAKALYGGIRRRKAEPSDVSLKLAEKRRRSLPIAVISPDGAIRYGLTELRPYEERELTERIACICEDYCATRRYLIDRKLMTRSDGIYTFTALGEVVWNVERSIMKRGK